MIQFHKNTLQVANLIKHLHQRLSTFFTESTIHTSLYLFTKALHHTPRISGQQHMTVFKWCNCLWCHLPTQSCKHNSLCTQNNVLSPFPKRKQKKKKNNAKNTFIKWFKTLCTHKLIIQQYTLWLQNSTTWRTMLKFISPPTSSSNYIQHVNNI